MPVYRIQTPEGAVLRVEGPPNATEAQLAQVLQAYTGASSPEAQIPTGIAGVTEQKFEPAWAPQPAPTVGEQLGYAAQVPLGAAEAVVSGATGALSMLGGTLKGIAEELLSGRFGQGVAEKTALETMQAGTYVPRTEAGRDITEVVGEAGQQLLPLAPLTAETAALGAATRAAAPAVRAAVETAPGAVRQALKPSVEPTPGTGRSVGAQAIDQAALRQSQAQELPVPIKLTEGQKTRTFEQQRFERETAKLPEEGAPLRERFAQQNLQLQQNLDAFIDTTGAELTAPREVGELVDATLRARAAKDKTKIRALYKEAEKAGEMQAPVDLQGVVDVLNESRSAESTAPVLGAARKELIRLGGAVEDENGNLIIKKPVSSTRPVEEVKGYKSDLSNAGRETSIDYAQAISRLPGSETAKSEMEAAVLSGASNKFAVYDGSDIVGVVAYDVDDVTKTITIDHIGSLKSGTGKRIVGEIERSTPLGYTIVLTPSNEGLGFWKKLGYTETGRGTELAKSPSQISGGITLQNTEQLRKFINKVTGNDPTNIKFAGDLKRAIDAATEGKGGEKYKQARRARAKYAQEYEDIGVVRQLLGTKRGTEDRAIALEDVVNKTVLSPSVSLDSMVHVRRLLQTKGGEPGRQAWRELQGATLRHIQEQVTKNVATDQAGNRIVSPAQLDRVITQLDRSGKLDYIFGKKGAEQLRTINEVAKDVLTSPPGTINTSNTASVLAGLMDVAISGTTGVPAPIMTSFRLITKSVKDAKLKARVKQSLGE